MAASAQAAETFDTVDLVDNFYQACAFIPMSFALVTTVHENGETGIGPHALLAPFSITQPYSMMLISRNNSGTAANIRRNGKCALNYVEYSEADLRGIAKMGYPGMSLADKEAANPYTMIDSPTPENAADPEFPKIIREAYQVMECTWDDSFGLHQVTDAKGNNYDGHFNLRIDQLLMQREFVPGIEQGAIFPNMPIFMGFRANRGFWFAEHSEPYTIELPKIEGMEYQSIFYMANRINADVDFTEEACRKLVGIPQPFMREALSGIVDRALADGVACVDAAYLDTIRQ
jgi:flavin reductase (DIM6/NTAB) family NADH-FMN oxidoreductase RutF